MFHLMKNEIKLSFSVYMLKEGINKKDIIC